MLYEDDEDDGFAVAPPPALQEGIYPIMELIIDLLESSRFHKLTYFLPVVFVNSLLLHDEILLLVGKGALLCFIFMEL